MYYVWPELLDLGYKSRTIGEIAAYALAVYTKVIDFHAESLQGFGLLNDERDEVAGIMICYYKYSHVITMWVIRHCR